MKTQEVGKVLELVATPREVGGVDGDSGSWWSLLRSRNGRLKARK